jgi:DNA repair protein RadD
MYATIFRACPAAQRIGLSATPSRMGGPIWGGEDAWFTCCQVTVGIRQLTPEFLAPLSTILTANDIDLSAVRIRAGEFVAAEASQAMSEEAVARRALEEVCLLAQHRQSWAVFCCDIAHAHLVARLLGELGISCGTLVSTQESAANDAALQAFGSGETRALVSCVMMTTGFDIPRIDCIVLLRPTMSKELLIQMIGRGTRLHPGKTDTLLLDYAGNLARHAPLEEIASTTRTPAREVRDEAELARSEEDRQREQERLARHGTSALGGDVFPVSRRSIEAYQKREDPTKHLVRVSYYCPTRPGQKWVSTFLCFQGYHGYPREQTQAWFERYGYVSEVATAEQGARVAQTFPCPQEVLVQEHRGFVKVIMEFFD